jgi:hypothetical protein
MNSAELIPFIRDDKEEHIFMYKGARCSQARAVFAALDELHWGIIEHHPSPIETIVEIGTMLGAFTAILRDHKISERAEVHTFDINDYMKDVGHAPAERVTYYRNTDVFGAGREALTTLLERPGRCMLFCDGGNKAKEIREFAPWLKPNDIVLGHDYVRTRDMEGSPATSGWGGEFTYADVAQVLEENRFEPFCEATMQRAVWGCWMARERDA